VIDALVQELRERPPAIVAIGASSGALEALTALLPPLPASFPSPLVVVVHIPADRPSGLPAVLAVQCAVALREAEDKMPFQPGTAYFAPPGYHLLVERHGAAALSIEDPVLFSRPSIDVLFDSVARSYGPRALGILLSGANADGAAGLAAMRTRGALTWVQTPESARVAAMPEAALRLAAHRALDPAAMGQALAAWTRQDG
jgi:two-component system chemotaxis response regulator CheB